MPELTFRVEAAAPVPFAAAPILGFKLRVSAADPSARIDAIALRCQLRIEATQRHYRSQEQPRLLDLFGEVARWGQTLRSLLWTHVSTVVPAFTGRTLVELQVPCSFDFTLAATKYFYALADGEVPLTFLLSGTIFQAGPSGGLQALPIPWDREAGYRLPITTWRALMDHHYPGSAWLGLERDVFDRLHAYKMERGLPTWERALDELLTLAREDVRA